MEIVFGVENKQEIKAILRKIPRVFIHWQDWLRILKYAQKAAPNEIMGLGKIKRIDDDFYISDILILQPDYFGPGGVDITEAAAQFVFELVQRNENPADYKFCWHSHVDGPAFWSDVDEETAINFNNEYMISLVFNIDGDYALRLDMFKPVKITIYNLPLKIILPDEKTIDEEVSKEIQEKFKSKFPFGRRKRQLAEDKAAKDSVSTSDISSSNKKIKGDEDETD